MPWIALIFLPLWVLIIYFLIGGAVISDRARKYGDRLDGLRADRSRAEAERDRNAVYQIGKQIDATMKEWSDERANSIFR